jgi:hypothetical protein
MMEKRRVQNGQETEACSRLHDAGGAGNHRRGQEPDPQRARSSSQVTGRLCDPSWALFAEGESQALCELAVFRGGVTRAAAAVAPSATLAQLAALVRKSFLRRSALPDAYPPAAVGDRAARAGYTPAAGRPPSPRRPFGRPRQPAVSRRDGQVEAPPARGSYAGRFWPSDPKYPMALALGVCQNGSITALYRD